MVQQYPRRGLSAYIVPILVLLLVTMTCLAVYAFTQGTRTQAESEKSAESAEILTAKVTQQTLAETYQAGVSAVEDGKVDIAPPVNPFSVITRESPAVGTVLGSGDILATIDERPLFVFEGSVPTYRDLAPGARGEDVAQVQQTLVFLGYPIYDEQGEYGKDTANAVYSFYLNSGYYPPGNVDASDDPNAKYTTTLPRSEYFFIPKSSYTVASRCGEVGKAPQQPLCAVSDGKQSLQFSLDSSASAQMVKSGQPAVVVLKDGQRIPATVGNLQPSDKKSSNEQSGISDDAVPENQKPPQSEDVQYFGIDLDIPEGSNLTDATIIVTTASSSHDAITVPETAISTEVDGRQFVTVEGQQVGVTTGYCQGGYCEIIEPSEMLTLGAELSLP